MPDVDPPVAVAAEQRPVGTRDRRRVPFRRGPATVPHRWAHDPVAEATGADEPALTEVDVERALVRGDDAGRCVHGGESGSPAPPIEPLIEFACRECLRAGGPAPNTRCHQTLGWGGRAHGAVRASRRAPWRPAPDREPGRAGERLATGDRLAAADDLVAHRVVLGQVPLLERRQPVVAHAQLRQRGELGRQRHAPRRAPDPGATTRLTRPIRSASTPSTPRPVRIRSVARLWPISRGRRTVPRSTSGTPKRRQYTPSVASDAATRRSHHSASSSPPATAGPSIAAMTGLPRRSRVGPIGPGPALADGAAVALGQRLEVGAGAEVAAGSGEHGDADVVVGVERLERLEQVRRGGRVDGVAPLRPVDRDDADRSLGPSPARVLQRSWHRSSQPERGCLDRRIAARLRP